MSENLFTLWTEQFSTNLQLNLQQMSSIMRGRVMEGMHVGKQASPVQYLAPVSLKAPAGRFAPKNRTDATFQRRWVFPQDGEDDQLIDTFDELKTIIDPKSQYVTNVSAAVGRAWDDAVFAAAFGTAQIGTDAGSLTGETFDTTQFQISDTFDGGGSSVGMTVAKLIEARRILRKHHVDLEADPATLVLGSQQEADLLKQVQVVSTEFNDKPVLVDGRITRFLGFDVVYSERLPYTSTLRKCLIFVKSGLYLGMWKDMTNRVSIRNDLSSEPYDLYTSVSFGATRLEPGRVLQVLCADTTGADTTP